jgi:putative tricarboxylic transport membrane protein
VRKKDIIYIILWNVVSLFFVIFSLRLGLGEIKEPGPGLFPFFLGILLFLVSFCLLVNLLFRIGSKDKSVKEKQGKRNLAKLSLVLASLLLYVFLLEKLGYLITSSIFLIIFFRSMGSKWSSALVASVLTALVTYFVFTYLGVTLPEGILKFRDLY